MSDADQKASIGSSLDDFLTEQGMYDSADQEAIKRVLSFQIEKAMDEMSLTKSAMAQQMGTSRSALDRLLDPTNDSVTLETLKKAAQAVGQRLEVRLVSV
jgi:predicted XRE-type DNA-binding protein